MLTALIIISLIACNLLLILGGKHLILKNKTLKIEHELNQLRAVMGEITGELSQMNDQSPNARLADILTGLPVRKVFEDRLTQTLNHCSRQASQFAVIVLDIDNFGEIDKLGKDIGDKILKEFARRMQLSIRQVDTVSRVAGGYFLFLLPHLSRPETAIYVCQRVQDNLLEPFRIGAHEVVMTVSMGISVYPVDGTNAENLMKNADLAMRQAKANGKNKYQFFEAELHQLGEREISIAQLVRSSDLMQRLRIQFRPFFDVDTSTPVYIQAIPHLHHPRHGMVAYQDYRNLAENSGKMPEITEWLLRNALDKFKQWHGDGFKPATLAIPVSLKQLENSQFIHKIREIREELNINSIKLVLEISDDNISQNTAYIENLFVMLNENNIEAAVGVIALGHFSMQKINKIPLNYLKIDSTLIKSSTQHKDKEALLNKIIELALDEKIIVMVEGVESESQMTRLRKLGCLLMEGKVFGCLMPTGHIIEDKAS